MGKCAISKRFGTGSEKVLVLHGWFGSSVYDGFLDSLGHQYEFAIVENPGIGAAKAEAPAADITELAHAQLALVDSLGEGWKSFHIVGHSYGGASALRIASLAPERVNSIMGICPVMPDGFSSVAAVNCAADENTVPTFLGAYAKGKEHVGGLCSILDPALGADKQKLSTLLDAVYECMDEATYKQYFGVWTGAAFMDDVKGLDKRCTFLYGKLDPMVQPNYLEACVKTMKSGSATVLEGPNGGHFLTVSDRDNTLAEVKKHLAVSA